jgi:hypothetical protein
MAAIFLLDVRLGQIGGSLQRRKIGLVISLAMDPRPEVLLPPTLMMIKSVATNGEEHVLLQQAASVPSLLKLVPILLNSAGGPECTLVVEEDPRE